MLRITHEKKVPPSHPISNVKVGTVFSGQLSIADTKFEPIGVFLRTNEGLVILNVVQAPVDPSWYFKTILTHDCAIRNYQEHKDVEMIIKD